MNNTQHHQEVLEVQEMLNLKNRLWTKQKRVNWIILVESGLLSLRQKLYFTLDPKKKCTISKKIMATEKYIRLLDNQDSYYLHPTILVERYLGTSTLPDHPEKYLRTREGITVYQLWLDYLER